MLDRLTAADFGPHRDSVFHLDLGKGGALDLRLAQIEAPAAGPEQGEARRRSGARAAPFSLLFVGPLAPLLAQRTYALDHPVFGRLEIFLVPLGPDGRGQRYEAVFN